MKAFSPLWTIGVLTSLLVSLTNCIGPDSGTESGTIAEIFDPDSYSCDPFNTDTGGVAQGIASEFYYLSDDQPRYGSVIDYINYGHPVEDILLFLNQVFIPTRPFDRGFTTASGQTITDNEGTTLYEYFAIRMKGRLSRGQLPAGNYQFALLADDGAVFDMNFGDGFERVVDDDGTHPTKMACANFPVVLDEQLIPFQLDYYQGPRYHISVVLLARPWPEDGVWQDEECGRQGNSRYFDSTQNPPAPSAIYDAMLARGWAPLEPDNFYLPEASGTNPCNAPAPIISYFQVAAFTNTQITLTWSTDTQATSQILYSIEGSGVWNETAESAGFAFSHTVNVSGLNSNTTYVLKAVSKSTSGLSSESALVTVRTRR